MAETKIAVADDAAAQYLTFVCAGEEYGVDILRVQEIKGWDGVTRVPYGRGEEQDVSQARGRVGYNAAVHAPTGNP